MKEERPEQGAASPETWVRSGSSHQQHRETVPTLQRDEGKDLGKAPQRGGQALAAYVDLVSFLRCTSAVSSGSTVSCLSHCLISIFN